MTNEPPVRSSRDIEHHTGTKDNRSDLALLYLITHSASNIYGRCRPANRSEKIVEIRDLLLIHLFNKREPASTSKALSNNTFLLSNILRKVQKNIYKNWPEKLISRGGALYIVPMAILISITGFLIASIYILGTYFPSTWEKVVDVLEFIGGSVNSTSPTNNDTSSFDEDSPSRGLWDSTSIYFASMHDDWMDNSSSSSSMFDD
jgi:hypothetical protein